MSLALQIALDKALARIDALEERMGELEAFFAGLPKRVDLAATSEPADTGIYAVPSRSAPPYDVKRGARGKWYVFKDGVRVSGGFDNEEDARTHGYALERGQVEAERLEHADPA